MKRRTLYLVAASFIAIISISAITAAVHAYRQDLQIKHLEQTKTQRETDLEKTQDQLKNTQGEKQQLDQKAKDQEKQIQDLNGQLQAKRAEQESIASAAARAATFTSRASAAPIKSGAVAGCGDNFYANFIYMHESGCRTVNPNGSGCDGIGQACPASKIAHCGGDYACQNAWFTAYAQKYGGWEGAYQFWLANHWW